MIAAAERQHWLAASSSLRLPGAMGPPCDMGGHLVDKQHVKLGLRLQALLCAAVVCAGFGAPGYCVYVCNCRQLLNGVALHKGCCVCLIVSHMCVR
jgi:hypothetical protein